MERAQDTAHWEKGFKAKCAGCHGADSAGKTAMKSPSIKGKTTEDIQKVIAFSPKHAGLKSLTADEVKDIAAYLGTMKYLRPARETCEQCHWPQRFSGDKFIVRTNYKDDEKNTPITTALVMKIGGHSSTGSVVIHGRHVDDGVRIRFISADEHRQAIPVVYYTDDAGKTVEFVSTDIKVSKQELEKGEHRAMDCIDCHNRPAHAFQLPENAVDQGGRAA